MRIKQPSAELLSAEPVGEPSGAELSIKPPGPLNDEPSAEQSSAEPNAEQSSANLIIEPSVAEPSIERWGAELSSAEPSIEPLSDGPIVEQSSRAEQSSAGPSTAELPMSSSAEPSADAPRTSSAKLSVESGREGAASSGRSVAVGKRGRGGTIASEHRHGDGERAC